jgi:hypothetical protein
MMIKVVNFGLALLLVLMMTGCEWESSGSEGSWDDSYSWVNFSGLYRSTGGALVGEFSSASTSSGSSGSETTGTTISIIRENDGVAENTRTQLGGNCNNNGIVPGSVTIRFEDQDNGLLIGSATDDGAGVLSGTYTLVGIDNTGREINGTIDYTTGTWAVNLEEPGFFSTANILLDYAYSPENASDIVDQGDNDSGMNIAGGDVMTMLVEQVGNRLRFVDSNGNSYEGTLNVVSLAGGDSTGGSSGQVTANYEVRGTAGGQMESLILAQNERWRRGLGMQVER